MNVVIMELYVLGESIIKVILVNEFKVVVTTMMMNR